MFELIFLHVLGKGRRGGVARGRTGHAFTDQVEPLHEQTFRSSFRVAFKALGMGLANTE